MLGERIREQARALGFDAVGFAAAEPELSEDHRRYEDFVAQGMHGDMGYLAEHAAARRGVSSPSILPGARTVICLARRYDRAEDADPPMARAVARYARGRDYHGFLRKRLRRLAAFVCALEPGVRARALCDTAPVLERAWAARAGLGFVGKNGMIIVPGQGSFCLLGEVVTTLEVPAGELGKPMGERCGSCTACLDACPTDAFAGPFVLDPRRCISYATIEARSAPPVDLAPAMAEHLFGCDECQVVCPYNRVSPPAEERTAPFRPLPIWSEMTLTALVSLDDAAHRGTLAGSPVRRATRVGLARNAVILAAQRAPGGDLDARAALAAAARHDDPTVRDLAARLADA